MCKNYIIYENKELGNFFYGGFFTDSTEEEAQQMILDTIQEKEEKNYQ